MNLDVIALLTLDQLAAEGPTMGTCHVPDKADVKVGVAVDVSDTGTYGGGGYTYGDNDASQVLTTAAGAGTYDASLRQLKTDSVLISAISATIIKDGSTITATSGATHVDGTYSPGGTFTEGQADQLATDQGVVLAAAASIKDDATILGQAGTYDYAAAIVVGYNNGAAAQLVTDKAAVAAAVAGILDSVTILTHTGTYHEAETSEVQDGVHFGPESAYVGTLEVTGAQYLVLTVGGT
jgi:hypothetical protein